MVCNKTTMLKAIVAATNIEKPIAPRPIPCQSPTTRLKSITKKLKKINMIGRKILFTNVFMKKENKVIVISKLVVKIDHSDMKTPPYV